MTPNEIYNEDQKCLIAGRATRLSAKLESVLETMGAAGKGLHEKTTSIANVLPAALVRQLRYIASVRNKLVHEGVDLASREVEQFEAAANEALHELSSIADLGTKRAEVCHPSVAIREHSEIRVLAWFFFLVMLGVGVYVVFLVFKTDLQRNAERPPPSLTQNPPGMVSLRSPPK